MALLFSGPGKKAHARSVVNRYRPILIYGKPPADQNILKKNRTHFVDFIQGTGKEKDKHEWQQSEEELRYIFDKMTEEGQRKSALSMFSGKRLLNSHIEISLMVRPTNR